MTDQKQLTVRPVMQINIADTGQIILQGESKYMEDPVAFTGLMGKIMLAMHDNYIRLSKTKIEVVKPKIDLKI